MQPCFLLSEVQHVNYIDRSFGVVFARWWRMGIFALARLAFGGQLSEDSELILSGGWTQVPLLSRQDSTTIKEKTNEPEHEERD
jgi:hypothetical protein